MDWVSQRTIRIKCTSFKTPKNSYRRKKGSAVDIGHKGIGLFSYQFLADRIEIISLSNEIISRFFMQYALDEDGEQCSAWSTTDITAISTLTLEQKIDLGIVDKDGKLLWQHGTKLRFYDITKEGNELLKMVDKIPDKLRDYFGLRSSRSPNLEVFFNGQKLELPNYLMNHPGVLIANIDKNPIVGAHYQDKKGESILKVIGKGGQLICEHKFGSPRRCTGWVYRERWRPDSSRRYVIPDEFWRRSQNYITKLLKKYDSSYDEPADEKPDKSVQDYISKHLADLLKANVPGKAHEPKKTLQPGNTNPADATTPGYKPSPTPDPNRKIIERKEHKRVDTNQQQVGTEGAEIVMRECDAKDDKRIIKPPKIDFSIQHFGPDRLLMDFFFEDKTEPATICINMDHALYKYKFRKGVGINERIADQLAIIDIKYWQAVGAIPSSLTWEEMARYQQLYAAEILSKK
jgi:hypothetical protein